MRLERLLYFQGEDLKSLFLRAGSSDSRVIGQIFIDQAYDLRSLARFDELKAFLERIRACGKRPLIIDAGANIGIASLYFAAQCPDALIVAIEPEPKNFALLRENVKGLPVVPIESALSSGGENVKVIDPDMGCWGFRTESTSDSEFDVQSVTIPEIFTEHRDHCVPFVVKIDIEGFEDNVFSKNTRWIDDVPILIVELHDWLLPKRRTSRNFLFTIADKNRDYVQRGENIFSIKNDLFGL
jgi:FkbM family methyltransferase